MSTLSQLLSQSDANITVSISINDLRDFHREVIEDTKKQLEDKIKASNAEVYLTIEEVTDILKVDRSTLHRWKKKNYLSPIEIGGKRRYLKSQIDKLINKDG